VALGDRINRYVSRILDLLCVCQAGGTNNFAHLYIDALGIYFLFRQASAGAGAA
jgi:hypothetical protein